jgi:hypothetical protein
MTRLGTFYSKTGSASKKAIQCAKSFKGYAVVNHYIEDGETYIEGFVTEKEAKDDVATIIIESGLDNHEITVFNNGKELTWDTEIIFK